MVVLYSRGQDSSYCWNIIKPGSQCATYLSQWMIFFLQNLLNPPTLGRLELNLLQRYLSMVHLTSIRSQNRFYSPPFIDQYYPIDSSEYRWFFVIAPSFWVDPLQTTTCGTPEFTGVRSRGLCLSRRVEWITRVKQCGLLRFRCSTGGSLQRVLWALRINRVINIALQFFLECKCLDFSTKKH